jgi:S-DNA-T family DNA segregation ATPase FtsK/SpoIIIE
MNDHRRAATHVDLRCTLVDATSGRQQHLEVVAPSGTTIGELLASAGHSGATAHVNGVDVQAAERLGMPPLVHGCLVVLNAPEAGPPGRQPSLSLDVVGGPDAGRILPLAPGDHVIGRCAPARLRLDDNEVSRRHAVVTVAPDAVTIQDLRSTNGSLLVRPGPDGSPVRLGTPTTLPVGGRIHAGRSTLELRSPHAVPAQTRVTGTGTIEVNRPPRHRRPVHDVCLNVPAGPADRGRAGVPWVGMAVPLVLSLGAAWLLRQPTYLLFGLMSPLVLAATSAVDRLSGRRRARRDQEAWRQQVAEVGRRARLALAEERAELRRCVGDPCTLSRAARLPSDRLWERTSRDDDLLVVSVGTADIASQRVRWLEAAQPLVFGSEAASVPDAVLSDAPVTVGLRELGHLGVCGDRATATRMLRWLLAQLAAWHGPSVVRIALVTDDEDEWSWTRWLPHHVATGTSPDHVMEWLGDLVRQRSALVRDGPWTGERLVVLVDGTRFACGGVRDALGCRGDIGVHVVCLADEPGSLASECGAVVTVTATGEGRLKQAAGEATFTVDGVRLSWAEDVARSLAPWREATPPPGHLPDEVYLSELLPVDVTDACAIASGWSTRPRSTRAVLGVGADGPLEIDLLTEGPHVLVAGTTGSGKSELLRTLVTSLAVVNRPDELSFVLVDYKGGAAFRGCAGLVHTTGLVTDLDDQLAARALVSLQSELRRREQRLQDAGCRDLCEYQARRDAEPTLPALPRLVLVVDEFRVLATELPDFLDGIVRVAAVGRSLGVHVILATQRPAGVVTADIKANVSLRICLRVRDRSDSDDVIDAPDAAGISPETPGRALLRRSADGLVSVQVATVDDDGRRAPDALVVQPWSWGAATAPPRALAPAPTELTRIAASCRAAAAALGIADPLPVWQPPLPARVSIDELEQLEPADARQLGAPLGLLDLPQTQDQPVVRWHPADDGHLAISGGARTGRTSALLTLAAGLVRGWPPHLLQLHVVTAGRNELTRLTELPHVGSVVSADEPHRVARLIVSLSHEAERRRAASHHADVAAPLTVLLVDGWEAVTEQLAAVDHGRPVDGLLSLLPDGHSVGVRAVVTGGRGVLLSRVGTVIANRLLLRPNDATDLLLAGVPSAAVPAHQPAGRALRPGDGAQLQIAHPPPLDHLLREVVDRWSAMSPRPTSPAPLRLRRLPDLVESTSLVTPRHASATWALVGCSEQESDAAGLDLADHRLVLVAGPPASGRSTTLVTMACSLHANGVPLLAVCPPSSPLARGPWATACLDSATDEQGLRHARVVLVDDVERVLGTALESTFGSIAADPHRTVVAAGGITPLLGAFRGLPALGRVHRSGVLLGPQNPSDGEVLGVRALLDDSTPPGRGVLVVRGQQTVVQVAVTALEPEENGRRAVGAGTYG